MRRSVIAAALVAGTCLLALVPLAEADPPDVTITSGPANPTTSTSASFTFVSTNPSATFQCRLDGGGYSGCSSPTSYTGLGDGSHSFQVRSVSDDGVSAPSTYGWTVDTTGPSLSLPDVIQNVNSVSSAVVSYSIAATDPSPPVTVTCTPPSGSTFPLGTTPVSCSATDGLGNASSGSFNVVVQDVTPPVIATPGTVTASVNGLSSTTVSYTVTASDGPAAITPSCSPPSGAVFPLGTTTVTCTATDAAGNTASASFAVVVQDTTPPVLKLPAPITVTVNGVASAIVSYTATATDGPVSLTPSCAPASGSSFPLGTTTVTCSATDAAGNTGTGSFTVTVRDTTPPTVTITSGPSGTVESASATFTFSTNEGTLSCSLDGGGFSSCSSPKTYNGLTPGSHTFRVRAVDAAGNTATASRTWSVDDTAPVLTTPGTLVLEANGPDGSVVTFVVTASDDGVAMLPEAITCAPASGSLFPLGKTTVQCRAADALGNVGTASFDVVVQDTTPPTLNVVDVTVAATSTAGIRRDDPAVAAYLGSITATDLVSAVTIVTNAPALFPVGVTDLRVTATDAAGNATVKTVKVTVLPQGQTPPPPPDQTPPPDVTRAKAEAGDHRVKLSWLTPRNDVAAVVVRMTVGGAQGSERQVYRGLRASVIVKGLRNEVEHRFHILTEDKAGNRSRGVVVLATPKAQLLTTPKPGQRVTSPPLLRWAPVPAASYFNVQLYRAGVKLLSAWPTVARYQLTETWLYDKSKRKLTPGTYTWYVWPGLGDKSEARYGAMLGKSVFVVVTAKRKPVKNPTD